MSRVVRRRNPKVDVGSTTFLKNIVPYSQDGKRLSSVSAEKNEELKHERMLDWITFFRLNISIFVEYYLDIYLHPYQRFWIDWMNSSTDFLGVASRASAKSWLIAVYTMARCILYPGTTVILASATKGQAGLIISEKCAMLRDRHPVLSAEIKEIVTNANKWEVSFYNGSVIRVVVSGENARGNRSNINIYEERRLIPKETIDSILQPFLVSRDMPFTKLPKYAGKTFYLEEPQSIIITSAYYKSYDWYPEAVKLIKKMASGSEDVKCIFLNYNTLIRSGIKTKKQMIRERALFEDPIAFDMEYGNIPYGESSLAFFKLNMFNRNIKRAWRPIRDEQFLVKKSNEYNIPKTPTELRLVSVDVAMRAGGDNTIITCARLFPGRKGYQTDFVYMESHNGKNTLSQSLRIKQICHEFDADAMVLDLAGVGISIFDSLSSVTKDETRGLEYKAYTVLNSKEIEDRVFIDLMDRTISKDAKPFIFPILATQQLNSAIAVNFKEMMNKKMINFLVDNNEAEDFLINSGNKDIINQEDLSLRAHVLNPHLQFTLAINEAISLNMDLVGASGLVKLVAPDGGRKDRYSSMSYLAWYVSLLNKDLLKENFGTFDDEREFLNLFQIV